MLSRKLPGFTAFAGTIAVSLWAWVPAASSGSLSVEDKAVYVPIQSISYEFGSKFMSGYFVNQAAICVVTLMIIEKGDSEEALPVPQTPTRVRLALYPGQIAGLDSEEGQSLNFTCGEDATTLLVDVGERDRLVAMQELALVKALATAPPSHSDWRQASAAWRTAMCCRRATDNAPLATAGSVVGRCL